MNKTELAAAIADTATFSKAQAMEAVGAVLGGITQALARGEHVRLVGFGTFSVRARAPSKGRNLKTGEVLHVAASMNARFKAGATLKAVLNRH